jgi:ethanolamine ammonia-lyase small subunit
MNRNLEPAEKRASEATADAWQQLRGATSARIALGRAGGSLPTEEWLDFKSSHAAARDAVHNHFHADDLAREVSALGLETVTVESAAADRMTFLQRPDLGRRLTSESAQRLEQLELRERPSALSIIVSDGLSALAVHRQAQPLLAALIPQLRDRQISLAPIVIARFGRVALMDEIGDLLGAELALILIGERPGLGSPDSLGAYLVYDPKPGNADANRNCVSNIRPEGLPIAAAADTLVYLISESLRRRLSGVGLKDERVLTSPPTAALNKHQAQA